MVESMDRGIGKVLAKLDELNLCNNTLVVFTSDNGGSTWSRNTPLRGSKSTIWEGGVRVPCLARWPGVLPRGKVTPQVSITMDWAATFRRSAGLASDRAGEDGIDLLPLITGKAPARDRTLFWRRKKGPVRKKVEEGRRRSGDTTGPSLKNTAFLDIPAMARIPLPLLQSGQDGDQNYQNRS